MIAEQLDNPLNNRMDRRSIRIVEDRWVNTQLGDLVRIGGTLYRVTRTHRRTNQLTVERTGC